VAQPKDAMTDGPTHRGEGKIERIDKDKITLSHGPIPSLQWEPMTMGFNLPANGLPGNIKVGDTVAFEIRDAGGGAFEITRIAPAPPSSTQTMKSNAKNGDVDDRKGIKK
jgi:Cu(I)/Ag(I) efflux system membrane fusion protein